MKIWFFFAPLLAATVIARAAIAVEIVAAGPAKVFEGATGETVTVVQLEPKTKGLVLIAFDGVDGDWDGKVVLHERTVNGEKEDYRVKEESYVSFLLRYGRWSAYPKGTHKELPLRYSKEASEKADATKIVAKYLAQLRRSRGEK